MTKEEAYDDKIAPLMQQIVALCKEHDIPIIAAFDLDDDTGEDRPGLACITSILPAFSQARMKEAHRALYPPEPSVMAFTIVTGPTS